MRWLVGHMSRDPFHRKSRHGIATLLAITLIGLVGASLAGMTAYSAFEVRRTRALADEARLRQLLLAGAADVLARSRFWDQSPPAGKWTLPLPEEMKDSARVEIQVEAARDGTAIAHIAAGIGAQKLRQTVHLARERSTWECTSAELDRQ